MKPHSKPWIVNYGLHELLPNNSDLSVTGRILIMIGTETVSNLMSKSDDRVLFTGGHLMVQEGDEGCIISKVYSILLIIIHKI